MRVDFIMQTTQEPIASWHGPIPVQGEPVLVQVNRGGVTTRKWYRVRECEYRINTTFAGDNPIGESDNSVRVTVTEIKGVDWE